MSTRDQSKNRREYSPNDVSTWFGVPRTTLFRWEAQKLIPEVKRNEKGERVFKKHHLKKIADVVKERIRNQSRHGSAGRPTLGFLYRTSEQLRVANFFSGSDTEKLRDLEWLKNAVASRGLSATSIEALWQEANQRTVGDDQVRLRILELIIENERSAIQRRERKHDQRRS